MEALSVDDRTADTALPVDFLVPAVASDAPASALRPGLAEVTHPHTLVIDVDLPEDALPLRHQRVVYSHSLRLQLIDWLVVLALTVDQVVPQIALSTVPSNLVQV